MAPNTPIEVEQEQPLSRTYQYRKVMKPMLERKRRARINKYLDELKDLMVNALANEGENVTKLEKADVLELTVRHLRKLKQNHLLGVLNPNVLHERYMAGFTHCASQVSTFLAASGPAADVGVSARLMNHVSKYMQAMEKVATIHGGFPPAPAPTVAPRIITPPLTPPGAAAHPHPATGTQHPHPLHRPMRVHCELSPAASASYSDLSPSASEASSRVSGSPRPEELVSGDEEKVWRPW
ncbi:enhancer of split mbeta protein-like [Amphibalanus amphitrite]|uniref:enhancer of split mbeta protein-like n=1 Tax=Amphibalanus amphitrite TaxID=1232801 RepID=UPI001C8FF69D|nr:enhancer of split mbeta protein-like [Amphibalanus amphitrite]